MRKPGAPSGIPSARMSRTKAHAVQPLRTARCTCVASNVMHRTLGDDSHHSQSPHGFNRTPTRPARKSSDPRRQVSWLTARAVRPTFPTGEPGQWHFGRASPFTVAGAAAASFRRTQRCPPSTAFPFHPHAPKHAREPSRASKQTDEGRPVNEGSSNNRRARLIGHGCWTYPNTDYFTASEIIPCNSPSTSASALREASSPRGVGGRAPTTISPGLSRRS